VHHQTTKKGAQIAEVTVVYKGGAVVHVSEGTDSLYASIDLVAHKLAQSMKKHNQKIRDKHRQENMQLRILEQDAALAVEEDKFDMNELISDLDPSFRSSVKYLSKSSLNVVREKIVDMPPISTDAAVSAMEFIDHPFYVFRNEETNEINVVYRRKEGGVGLIKPTK
jgi:putative sigma-54 modulation protein